MSIKKLNGQNKWTANILGFAVFDEKLTILNVDHQRLYCGLVTGVHSFDIDTVTSRSYRERGRRHRHITWKVIQSIDSLLLLFICCMLMTFQDYK